jgi:tRNA nucleotidyltransferase/poly(A) polymerase
MIENIKKIIAKTDRFLFKKFGSEKNIKSLENLKEAKIIFSHLNEMGSDPKVRFVGGCVRKAVCGEEIDDIDLATSLEPNDVKKKLLKSNIKTFDTGILYGTITAIINKKKFEITSLRKDLSTDGRHPEVEFTSDWEKDALRRDLTINAIYADIDGNFYDPLNGFSDLKSGKIKFIGSPTKRIQEDYLRILRYFRFFTQYSKIDYDDDTIAAIKQNVSGINKISNERIYDELTKILSLNNLNDLFENKKSKEVILNIFPQFKYYERLKSFNVLKEDIKNKFNFKLILALLIIDSTDNYEFFCYKHKTSGSIKDKLKIISQNFKNLKIKKFYTEQNLKKLIYLNDKSIVKDIMLFAQCINNNYKKTNIEDLLNIIDKCDVPKFPISGNDLKRIGYVSGEELGKKLKSLEKQWLENNFVLNESFKLN